MGEGALASVAYGNGVIVAVGGGYNTALTKQVSLMLTSPDGIVWQQIDHHEQVSMFSRVVFGGGRFLALSERVVTREPILLTSTDGGIWQEIASPASLDRIIWDGARFVGSEGMRLFESADGINWQEVVIHTPQGEQPDSVTFLAATTSGTVGGAHAYCYFDQSDCSKRPAYELFRQPTGEWQVSRAEGTVPVEVAVGPVSLGVDYTNIYRADTLRPRQTWQALQFLRADTIAYANGRFVIGALGLAWSSDGTAWQTMRPTTGPTP